MSRESWEVSEGNHLNEVLGLPNDTCKHGYYPGEHDCDPQLPTDELKSASITHDDPLDLDSEVPF